MTEKISDLITVLQDEKKAYDTLYGYAQQKRDFVVNRDLEGLEKLTSDEQTISSRLKNLEKKRMGLLSELLRENHVSKEEETVTRVIESLNPEADECKALVSARDELVSSATQMQFMNRQNEVLLQQALEMVEFDLTLFKSLRQAPETANYNRSAYNTGDILPKGGFDAKQ